MLQGSCSLLLVQHTHLFMLITNDKQVLQDTKMFSFMFAWVQQYKIVIQIMSHMAVRVGGTAFVGRVTFLCSIPVTCLQHERFQYWGFSAFFVCCFIIATRHCTCHDRKLLWVVVGVATEELSPQLVRNQELWTLKCWCWSSTSSGALGQGPHRQTRLTSSLLFTQRPHGFNPAFHILPAAYVGLYLLSNLAPHLSTDWVPPQGSETLCYWISSDTLSL